MWGDFRHTAGKYNVAEIPGLPTNVLSMMTSSNDTSRDLDNSLIKWLYNQGEHVRLMIKSMCLLMI